MKKQSNLELFVIRVSRSLVLCVTFCSVMSCVMFGIFKLFSRFLHSSLSFWELSLSILSCMCNVLQCYVLCNVWYLQTLLKVLAQFFILLGIISVNLQFYVYVLQIVVCPFVLFLLAIVFLFFDLRILITPLVSSYCSCLKYIQILKYQIVSADSMKIWKVVGGNCLGMS